MDKLIITIGRQYGSGGKEIGQKLAERLGIPFYDKELLTAAAKKSGICEEMFAAHDEKPTNSFLYSLVVGGYAAGSTPINHKLFLAQFDAIKSLAKEGSCVILGRCGDYVLRDRPNVLRTFVFAPIDIRVANAKVRPDAKDMPDRLWETHLAKHDRARASYYNYYTENRWGEAKNYDLCLNAAIGQDACAQLIVQAAKAMEAANQE